MSASADGSTAFGIAESEAALPDRRPYANRYCFLARLRDGRIHEFTEYFDALAVLAVFGTDNPAHGKRAPADDNRTLALRVFEAISNSDYEALQTLMADDVSWWSAGEGQLPGAGNLRGPEVLDGFQGITGLFPEGLRMAVGRTICEDDKVAAEVESRGVTSEGIVYRNKYLFLLRFADGRLVEGREYADTLYVRQTLFPDGV